MKKFDTSRVLPVGIDSNTLVHPGVGFKMRRPLTHAVVAHSFHLGVHCADLLDIHEVVFSVDDEPPVQLIGHVRGEFLRPDFSACNLPRVIIPSGAMLSVWATNVSGAPVRASGCLFVHMAEATPATGRGTLQ